MAAIMFRSRTRMPARWVLGALLGALAPGAGLRAQAPAGDPAAAVIRPDAGPGVGSLDFPMSAYRAFGSSLARSGRFAELGWTEQQLGAFLEGMRAFLHGNGYPMDDAAQGLAAEMARRMGGGSPGAGAPGPFPLSAYSAFGSSLAHSARFAELGWTDAELGAFLEGIRAAVQGKPFPMDDTAKRLTAEMGHRVADAEALAAQQAAGRLDPKARLERYFKGMRRRLGLQIADSGLGYNVQTGRNGIRPRPGDTIEFSCVATTADGHTRIPELCTERTRARMEGMLPGLAQGMQMMTVGSSAVFVLPPSLSFGDGEWPPGVERGSPLVYYINLGGVAAAGRAP
jgi:FKBP-type peptidyl-prolyl cis-trans isomerase